MYSRNPIRKKAFSIPNFLESTVWPQKIKIDGNKKKPIENPDILKSSDVRLENKKMIQKRKGNSQVVSRTKLFL
jgi:hypothetical protein